MIYDSRACELGEGPLWHPERGQLFWFDVLSRKLLSRDASGPLEWDFPEIVSAAGWVDRDRLVLGSESGLSVLDLSTGQRSPLCDIEAGDSTTRSNDGRADPMGGFWIGTMAKDKRKGAGAIYRWKGGELRRLFAGITIPNAICFAPDGRTGYFTDTTTNRVQRVALDAAGWPVGTPEVFLDLSAEGRWPDGAVTDAEGRFWNAQWGSSRVACYSPQGEFLQAVAIGAPHSSCPAFGGADFSTLYCTTALEELDAAARKANPESGKVFALPGAGRGRAEARVLV